MSARPQPRALLTFGVGAVAVVLTLVGIFLPERWMRLSLAAGTIGVALAALWSVWQARRALTGPSAELGDDALGTLTLGMVGLLCTFVLLIT